MKNLVKVSLGEVLEFKEKLWKVTKIKRKKLEVTLMSKREVKKIIEAIQNRKEEG